MRLPLFQYQCTTRCCLLSCLALAFVCAQDVDCQFLCIIVVFFCSLLSTSTVCAQIVSVLYLEEQKFRHLLCSCSRCGLFVVSWHASCLVLQVPRSAQQLVTIVSGHSIVCAQNVLCLLSGSNVLLSQSSSFFFALFCPLDLCAGHGHCLRTACFGCSTLTMV